MRHWNNRNYSSERTKAFDKADEFMENVTSLPTEAILAIRNDLNYILNMRHNTSRQTQIIQHQQQTIQSLLNLYLHTHKMWSNALDREQKLFDERQKLLDEKFKS